MSNYCTACGEELKSSVKFCTKCGNKVMSKSTDEKHKIVASSVENSNFDDGVIKPNSLKNVLLGFYVLLNIPLYAISGANDQMIGFMFYSLVITIVIALRIKKENTFNWVLKILIVLQLLFVLSIFGTQAGFLFIDLISIMGTILFFLLALVLIAMLVKGNNR